MNSITRYAPHIEAVSTPVPDDKRLPFGWSAFAVSPTQNARLKWPEPPSFHQRARLRITVALDCRENTQIEVKTAQSEAFVGIFDLRFPSICQPFEIVVDVETANLAAREGVILTQKSGEKPFFLFDGNGGAPTEFAPHWLEANITDQWAQFEARLCSLASISTFGWIEGCVMDGLWQMAQNGHEAAKSTLESHLRLFVSPTGDLDYEGPTSQPRHNAIYGMEGLLPFALIAQIEPQNPVLQLAEREIRARLDSESAVIDGDWTTTEGVYIAGYPLAVLGKLWARHDLQNLALAQLRTRQQRNLENGTIFQSAGQNGQKHLPNWARGVAWYLLGFARVLDVLQPGEEAADLYEEFKRAAVWAMEFQLPNGLWRNFFDDLNSEPDTSGSSGIAAALALGARHGWLPEAARGVAERTLNGLETFLTPDGFLGGMAQFNKGGEALQRANYRVMAPMAMGLAAQLRTELQKS